MCFRLGRVRSKSHARRDCESGLTVQEILQTGTLKIDTRSHGVDHVTIMGMGEPLRNYASTTRAVRLLNEELGIVLTVIIAYIYHLQNIMIGIRLDNI